MKKNRSWLIALLSVIFALTFVFAVSCGKDKESDSSEKPNQSESVSGSISLDKEALELDLDEKYTLVATTEGTSAQVVWTSSDEKVATVNGGAITPVGEGVANIIASVGNISATCALKVYNSYSAPFVSLGDSSITLEKNDEYDVSVSIRYKGEDVTATADYSVSYADGAAENVARAEKRGNALTITALDYGTTKFYVSATLRGILAAAEIEVNVKSLGVMFDIANLTPENGGYLAKLATTNAGGYIRSITPEISVFEGGNKVSGATVALTSANLAVAKVENGTISAVSVGETVVTVNYNGNEIDIRVTVEKPTFVSEGKLLIEAGELAEITYSEALAGTFVGATIDGNDVAASFAGNTLVLDKSKIDKMPLEAYGEGKELIVETDEAYYASAADVYTLVIETVEDYNRMGELSKAAGASDVLYGGYFVLGNDIFQEGGIELNEFLHRYGTGMQGNGTTGFTGIFDGKGHTIDGLYKIKTGLGGGFIGLLAGGVIRNVSLTNFVMDDTFGCAVTHAGIGTIENVYVSYKSILNCDPKLGGTFFGANNANRSTPSIINCLVDTLNAEITDAGMKYGVLGSGGVSNCVVLMPEGSSLAPANGTGTIWGDKVIENDLEDARSSESFANCISGWDRDFWYVVNSLAVPRGLYNNFYADGVQLEVVNEVPSEINEAATIKVRTNQNYYVLSVDENAGKKGVIVKGSSVIVPLTSDMTVTVTISSVFNSSNNISFSFEILGSEIMEGIQKIKLELSVKDSVVSASSEKAEIDLSDYAAADGSVEAATLEGKPLDIGKFSLKNRKLTIDSSVFGLTYGEKMLGIKLKNGESSSKIIINCLFVSKTIRTKADLDLIGTIGKACEADSDKLWGGYFELGNDIDLTGLSELEAEMKEFIDRGSISISADGDQGFKGVIDGMGYKIIGLRRAFNPAKGNAFISVMHNDGVLRNIAFTDCVMKANNGSFIAHVGGGTFENIYVSYKEISTQNQYSGTFFGARPTKANMKGVVVDASSATVADGTIFMLLGQITEPNGIFGIRAIAKDNVSGGIRGIYTDYAAFKDAVDTDTTIGNNIRSWDKTYWDMSSGYPIFKSK